MRFFEVNGNVKTYIGSNGKSVSERYTENGGDWFDLFCFVYGETFPKGAGPDELLEFVLGFVDSSSPVDDRTDLFFETGRRIIEDWFDEVTVFEENIGVLYSFPDGRTIIMEA